MIFVFVFVTQSVKNFIFILIRRLCLLQIIFVFVFVNKKSYWLQSDILAFRLFLFFPTLFAKGWSKYKDGLSSTGISCIAFDNSQSYFIGKIYIMFQRI